MLPLWAQWIGVAGSLLAILSVFGAMVFAWVRLNSRQDRTDRVIQLLVTQANGHLALTGSLIGALNRRGDFTQEEMADFLRTYTELARIPSAPNNPLSSDEYQRLTDYVELAKKGGPFTPDQVRDYQTIVKKLEKEKPQDEEIMPFVALGALLSGMFLSSRPSE